MSRQKCYAPVQPYKHVKIMSDKDLVLVLTLEKTDTFFKQDGPFNTAMKVISSSRPRSDFFRNELLSTLPGTVKVL